MTDDARSSAATISIGGLSMMLEHFLLDLVGDEDSVARVERAADNSVDAIFESGTRLNVLVRDVTPRPRHARSGGILACGCWHHVSPGKAVGDLARCREHSWQTIEQCNVDEPENGSQDDRRER